MPSAGPSIEGIHIAAAKRPSRSYARVFGASAMQKVSGTTQSRVFGGTCTSFFFFETSVLEFFPSFLPLVMDFLGKMKTINFCKDSNQLFKKFT